MFRKILTRAFFSTNIDNNYSFEATSLKFYDKTESLSKDIEPLRR
jgi:hypothetical protein